LAGVAAAATTTLQESLYYLRIFSLLHWQLTFLTI